MVGTGASVGTAGGASAGVENGLALVCARGCYLDTVRTVALDSKLRKKGRELGPAPMA